MKYKYSKGLLQLNFYKLKISVKNPTHNYDVTLVLKQMVCWYSVRKESGT